MPQFLVSLQQAVVFVLREEVIRDLAPVVAKRIQGECPKLVKAQEGVVGADPDVQHLMEKIEKELPAIFNVIYGEYRSMMERKREIDGQRTAGKPAALSDL